MSLNKIDRLQELKAALLQKESEYRHLEQRKQELLARPIAAPHDESRSEVNKLLRMHPILSHCKRPRQLQLMHIPPEQVGNITVQVEAAIAAAKLQIALVQKQTHDARWRLQKLNDQHVEISEQVQSFSDVTGIPLPTSSPSDNSGVKRAHVDPKRGAAPRAPAAAYTSPDRASAKELSEEMKRRFIQVTKETRLADIVRKKNAKILLKMEEEKKQLLEEKERNNQLRNELRCHKRDIAEKKIELERLLIEHETLDKHLTRALNPPNTTRLILDRDVAELKRKVEDCVEGERRVQERVIKAQEYRIAQLERRLAAIKRALKSHGLEAQVDAILLAHHTASKEASPEPASAEDRDALYDMDRIVPPQETVHPAVYSLFVSEKEALARSIAVQQTIIREKDEVVDRLADEVARMTLMLDEAQSLLHVTSQEVALAEEDQREVAEVDAMQQRDQFVALLQEKIKLRKIAHKQSSRERSSASGQTSNGSRDTSLRSSASPEHQPSLDAAPAVPQLHLGSEIQRGELLGKKSSSRVRFADQARSSESRDCSPEAAVPEASGSAVPHIDSSV